MIFCSKGKRRSDLLAIMRTLILSAAKLPNVGQIVALKITALINVSLLLMPLILTVS